MARSCCHGRRVGGQHALVAVRRLGQGVVGGGAIDKPLLRALRKELVARHKARQNADRRVGLLFHEVEQLAQIALKHRLPRVGGLDRRMMPPPGGGDGQHRRQQDNAQQGRLVRPDTLDRLADPFRQGVGLKFVPPFASHGFFARGR